MIPTRGVIAGPRGGVALSARITGSRQNEWAFIRIEFEQSFIRCARIFHTKHVMNFQVAGGTSAESRLMDAMLNIVRHSFTGHLENRRLVHIVPKAGHALRDKIFVKTAPPGSGFLACEIRKNRRAWPNRADKDGTVVIFYEMVTGNA